MLRYTEKEDEKVVSKVEVYSSHIDPNLSTLNDKFVLKINGKIVSAPEDIVSNLFFARRAFSYDYFTKGIKKIVRPGGCLVGGPEERAILQTLYLTYEKLQIVGSKMKTVYTEVGYYFFPNT